MPVFSIHTFQIPAGRYVYFDANIWLMLYGPEIPKDDIQEQRSDAYAKLFCRIATRKVILTSQTVLSEFINRFVRFEYQLSPASANGATFKEFRKSPQFRAIAKDVRANVKKILAYANITEEPLFADSESFWTTFSSGACDFNDHLIYQFCQKNDCILVTDDGDMKFPDIDILTGNRRLLR